MSIIEKAMQKLNGGRTRPQQGAMAAVPKIVEHPASHKLAEQSNAGAQVPRSLGTSPHPTPFEKRVSLQRIARLRPGDVASDHLTPQIAEEYRRIKRPLLANAFGKGALQVDRGTLIMVTSSVPGEGKSRTSINLTRSIALEPDHTVLLIDADVAKAQVSRMYQLEKQHGLTDILSQHLNPDELIWATDHPDISVLPVGGRHPHSTELLNSNEMEQLITRLAEQDPSRVLILDSPPVLATNEPQVLARMVGQIVLVVEAGRTPQHVVKEAVAALDPARAIGLVLNKSQYSVGGDYYGHYYGGYYGYGGEPDNEGNRKGAGK
jgi:protein-tyrosine kinase